MYCPFCLHEETKVLETRESEEGITRRRRECEKCVKRFTTHERMETSGFFVIKKDGSREQYSREKIKSGILKACEKRPISTELIEQAVDQIEARLRKKEETEIPSKLIGELVMEKLKRMDKVAYIRFASVYRSFEDVESFQKEIRALMGGRSVRTEVEK